MASKNLSNASTNSCSGAQTDSWCDFPMGGVHRKEFHSDPVGNAQNVYPRIEGVPAQQTSQRPQQSPGNEASKTLDIAH